MDHHGARAYILRRLREELPNERTYHSLEHTLDVYAAVIDIAAAEGVEGDDLILLKTAALYHDAGFTVRQHDHEEAGCAIVREVLPTFGYPAIAVERVCAMIMATRVPQRPADLLERILCDADLDYLGRPDFKRIGDMLFAELRAYGILRTEVEWNRLQVRFLEEHGYHTATNRREREPAKQEHLEVVRAWLRAHDRPA